uniref:G-protein coupled receptors family 1 profile domain-containing protein n=1 Tax=Anser brachyrhynchus TaxID=132585 RepID=A0A8B9D149_9AVES
MAISGTSISHASSPSGVGVGGAGDGAVWFGSMAGGQAVDGATSQHHSPWLKYSVPPIYGGHGPGDGDNGTRCFAGHVPEIVISSIMLLIGLCGLVGNGTILWLLGFHIRRNLFTSYVLNLAVADACFLLCTSVSLVMYHVPMLSCFHPQLLHVLLPFHSRFSCSGLSPVCCQGSCTLCMIWVTLNAAGWFLQPSAFSVSAFSPPFMVISNVILFIKLRCRSWQYHPGRLYIIFLNFYVYTNFIFDICLLLAAINSSSNPIIYVLVGNYKKQNFRESVKMALQRVFEDRADPRMVGEGPVSTPSSQVQQELFTLQPLWVRLISLEFSSPETIVLGSLS